MDTTLMQTQVKLINQKVKFACTADGKEPVHVDYVPPVGDDEGYKSLDLLLFSLSTCIGTGMALVLRKMQKTITGLQIDAQANRLTTHPTVLTDATLTVEITSSDMTQADAEKAWETAKNICPVSVMLHKCMEIKINFSINNL